MHTGRCLFVLFAACVAVTVAYPQTNARLKRQLADDDQLQPLEDIDGSEQTREKRKLEGVTQAKFGVKNAILGFVFGDGITSRHRKSRSLSSFSKDTTTLNQGRTLSRRDLNRHLQPKSDMGLQSPRLRLQRQVPTTADGIPIFDRNKVSLDFPGNLFGPSVSLLIKTTKIVGDVIQNSAVRYQTFLRLFRPLFRGPFEIKGLDPPTTTTTTTTTEAPAANEVRR